MKKIAEISPKSAATMTVYYDNTTTTNPYRVYREWNDLTQRGIVHRRKQVARYGDLASCAGMMYDWAFTNNEERR